MENNSPDWAAIRREYASKTKSIRQLARDFDVSDTAIRKRAKAEKWDETGSQSGSHLTPSLVDGDSPDWSLIYDDNLEIAAARRYWGVIVSDLRDNGRLSEGNFHTVKRLVQQYISSDRASEKIAEYGEVTTGKRGGQILNPWVEVLKAANAMALALESELMITPRRRNNGGAVQRKKPPLLGGGYLNPGPDRPGNPVGH